MISIYFAGKRHCPGRVPIRCISSFMYFNHQILALLYKITNTNSPEFKSDLHASNGIKANNNGYRKIADEEQSHSEGKEKKPLSTNEQKNSAKEAHEEKGDGKKEEKQQEERKENGGEKQPLKGKVYNVIGNRTDQQPSFKNRNRIEGLFLGIPLTVDFLFFWLFDFRDKRLK